MRYLAICTLSLGLAACATQPLPDITLDAAYELQQPGDVAEPPAPPEPMIFRTYAPSVQPPELRAAKLAGPSVPPVPSLKPYQTVDRANAAAAVQPALGNYMNAVQVYPYQLGALYQVYTAPGKITDIALQPGEELVSVSAGDTVRWVLGDTVSGYGETAQVHILIKPMQAGLTTNLIIITSARTYHIELKAFQETYMAAVSWHYPDEMIRARASLEGRRPMQRPGTPGPRGLQLDRIKFRYEITGDTPHWRPQRVFDDGWKVYVQFPPRMDQGEAPPLFLIGRDGKSQLVNYRMQGNYYVVDRLFARAELRLGERAQDVVRITRNDLGDRS